MMSILLLLLGASLSALSFLAWIHLAGRRIVRIREARKIVGNIATAWDLLCVKKPQVDAAIRSLEHAHYQCGWILREGEMVGLVVGSRAILSHSAHGSSFRPGRDLETSTIPPSTPNPEDSELIGAPRT